MKHHSRIHLKQRSRISKAFLTPICRCLVACRSTCVQESTNTVLLFFLTLSSLGSIVLFPSLSHTVLYMFLFVLLRVSTTSSLRRCFGDSVGGLNVFLFPAVDVCRSCIPMWMSVAPVFRCGCLSLLFPAVDVCRSCFPLWMSVAPVSRCGCLSLLFPAVDVCRSCFPLWMSVAPVSRCGCLSLLSPAVDVCRSCFHGLCHKFRLVSLKRTNIKSIAVIIFKICGKRLCYSRLQTGEK